MRGSVLLGLVVATSPLAAQQATRTVSPGMSKAQVVAALGEPATLRTASEFTYMFYRNACGKRCGMNDLVVLQRDSVVDAIFRAPERRYTGTSSSPVAIPPAVAARQKPSTAGQPLTTDSVRRAPTMRPGPANDIRPSIPKNDAAVRPVPPVRSVPTPPVTRPATDP